MPQSDRQSAAFVAWVAKTYAPDLHRFLVKRLRSGEDANDVAQEVYLRLLRLNEVEHIRQPLAYVYFIAWQVVAEGRIRTAKRPVIVDSELAERACESLPAEPDPVAEREEARRDLTKLLSKLSRLQRSAFLLRKREGCSTEEIAARLNVSTHKVLRALVQANSVLAQKLHQGRYPP